MSFCSVTLCNAQENGYADIKAYFNPSKVTKSLAGDKVAVTDDVQCVITSLEDVNYEDNEIGVPAGSLITITSKTFKNIMGFKFYVDNLDSQVMQIVSAEGSGFSSISELNKVMVKKENVKTEQKYVNFYFDKPLVLLSEVQLEVLNYNYILKVEVSLNVEPEFTIKDGDTIYGDDTVPFIRRSNYMTYCYGVDVKEPDNSDEFCDVPADGIKLTGQTKGQHTVYLDVDQNLTSDKRALRTVTVNYDPEKQDTTPIISIMTDEDATYYDLTGHRIAPKAGQLIIRKVGSTSKLIRL